MVGERRSSESYKPPLKEEDEHWAANGLEGNDLIHLPFDIKEPPDIPGQFLDLPAKVAYVSPTLTFVLTLKFDGTDSSMHVRRWAEADRLAHQ